MIFIISKMVPLLHAGKDHLSFPGQAFCHAHLASHWWNQPGRPTQCRSRSVSHILWTQCLACAWLCSVFDIFRLSPKDLFTKKTILVNKSIVHLVDDIFWNCGFKTESHVEQEIIDSIVVIYIIAIIALIVINGRFMSIWALQTTCGRKSAPQSLRRLTIWEISSVWPCERAGLHTSRRPIRRRLSSQAQC